MAQNNFGMNNRIGLKKTIQTQIRKMHLHWQLAFNNGNTAKQAYKLLLGYAHAHDSEFILFRFLKYEIQIQTNVQWITYFDRIEIAKRIQI